MRKYIFYFTVMIFYLLIGCDNGKHSKIIITGILTNNYHPVFDLSGLYDTTYSRTKIYVGEYMKGDLRGAIVKVSSENQTVQFTGVEKNRAFTYQDTGNHLIITPGEKYYLYIKIPDGRVFESETRIPFDPVIYQPVNGDTLILGQDIFEYERNDSYISCRAPYVYQKDPLSFVQLHIKYGYLPSDYGFTYIADHHDSLYAPIFHSSADPQKNQVDLLTLDSSFSMYSWFLAYFPFGSDSLYTDLYDKYSNLPLKYASNIRGENVVGCFGSYSRTSSVYYLRKP